MLKGKLGCLVFIYREDYDSFLVDCLTRKKGSHGAIQGVFLAREVLVTALPDVSSQYWTNGMIGPLHYANATVSADRFSLVSASSLKGSYVVSCLMAVLEIWHLLEVSSTVGATEAIYGYGKLGLGPRFQPVSQGAGLAIQLCGGFPGFPTLLVFWPPVSREIW